MKKSLSDEPTPMASARQAASAVRSRWILAVALCLTAAMMWLRMTGALTRGIYNPDFSIAYTQSLVLRRGHNPYVSDITPFADRLGLDVHPIKHAVDAPSMMVLFELIAAFTPATGYWIWFAINVGLLLAAMAMLLGRGEYGAGSPEFWIAAALILLYPPVWCNFLWAQTQVLALFLLTLAALRVKRRDDASAAALVAIAGCLRIYPFAAMGFFLVKRKWRALASAAIVAGAITGVTMAIAGVGLYLTYFRGLSYAMNMTVGNASMAALATRMVAAPALRWFITLSTDATLVLLATRTTVKSDDTRAFMLWIVSAVALSPIVWIHYFVLLLIPFSEILFDACRGRSISGAAAAIANYLVIVLVLANEARSAAMNSRSAVGQHVLRDGLFVALALGYMATYLFANQAAKALKTPVAEDAAQALLS